MLELCRCPNIYGPDCIYNSGTVNQCCPCTCTRFWYSYLSLQGLPERLLPSVGFWKWVVVLFALLPKWIIKKNSILKSCGWFNKVICSRWNVVCVLIMCLCVCVCLLQAAEKQLLLTPSAQRASWMRWVGRAVRVSFPPAAAAEQLVPKTSRETGYGAAVGTTSTTATVSPGSLWTPASARKTTHVDLSNMHTRLWTYRTMKPGEWWGNEHTYQLMIYW